MATLPGTLAAAVRSTPELVGALCAGRSPMFDYDVHGEPDEIRDYRHARAAAVCGRCPATDECRAAAQDLGRHAQGVWAGKVLGGGGRP